jgi:transposase
VYIPVVKAYLGCIYQSVQSFREVIRDKDPSSLDYWINDNIRSAIIHIKKFAQILKKDVTAVSNTLKYEYTNAVLQGHVNRLKNINRMIYVRASFNLLTQRVLFQIYHW